MDPGPLSKTIPDYVYRNGALQLVDVPRPTTPPSGCGFSDVDLTCEGCGCKLGSLKPGRCYAVEGNAALKGYADRPSEKTT